MADASETGGADGASAPARPVSNGSVAPWSAALLSACAALVYLLPRLARELPFEDAGLFAAAAHSLGVPHPPGYPLWTLLGALTLAVSPLPDVLSLALVSAAGAALASGALAALAASRGAPLLLAGAVGLAPLCSATFVSQATTIEVYALAGGLQALALCAALLPRPRPRLAAVSLGLGLAAHPNTLFLLPAVAALCLLRSPRPRPFLGALAWLALPLSLYGYVPLAASRAPAVNWGEASNIKNLWAHLTRSQYQTGLERETGPLLHFLAEQGPMQLPLVAALAAGVLLWRRQGRALLGLGACLAAAALSAYWAIAWPMNSETRARLAGSLLPLILPLCAAASLAAGAWAASGRLGRAQGALGGLVCLALLALAGGPLAPKSTHSGDRDRSHQGGAQAWATALLGHLPENALLVVQRLGAGDILGFPLLYAQVVLGVRTDVVIVDRGLLPARWYRDQLVRRAPDLKDAVADLDAALRAAPGDPRSARLASAPFLKALMSLERPVCFTDLPGPAVLEGAELVPGPLHLEHAQGARREQLLAMPPPAPALEVPDAGAWRGLFEELAAERQRLRSEAKASEPR